MNLGERICSKLIKASPDNLTISNVRIGNEGRVQFRVPVDNLCGGDSRLKTTLSKIKTFSDLSVFDTDTIGELIVRKKLPTFITFLSKMSEDDYNKKLMAFSHLHFSLQKTETEVELTFHVSLLHDIILEKLASQVKKN